MVFPSWALPAVHSDGILDGLDRPVSGGELLFLFFLLLRLLLLLFLDIECGVGLSRLRFGEICKLELAIQLFLETLLLMFMSRKLIIRVPSQPACVVLSLGFYRAVAAVMAACSPLVEPSSYFELASSMRLVGLLAMLKRGLLVKFVPVCICRVLQGLAREQTSRSKLVLLLVAIDLIIASNYPSVVRQLVEKVLLRRGSIPKVKLVNVLVDLARLYLINSPAQTVEPGDVLLQVVNDTHSCICVLFKAAEDQVLVRVVEFIPILNLVEIGEELPF